MSEVYSKKAQEDVELKRDFLILKPLLQNIKVEEKSVYSKVKSKIKNLDIDFKTSLVMFSNKQVYKSYSIMGLMTSFNRDVKYYVVDLSILLDVWYNHSTIIDKSKLLSCDVLIMHGFNSSWQAENKKDALIELVSTRKTIGKLTWLFIEQSKSSEFNKLYPGVTKAFGKTYNSEF